MDFVSPRLQAHARLRQILNQPPTGTMHLEQGDTGADVQAVQQALWDLTWTFRIQPQVEDVNQFVIGTYGPITSKVVLTFRTHYGIVFPGAAAATSTIGTATLMKLDSLITQYDASAAAIRLHAQKLTASGTRVTLDNDPRFDPYPATMGDTGGVQWQAFVDSVSGGILHKASTGAFYVIEPIWGAYLEHGFGSGPLGFPIWDTYRDTDGGLRNDFEGGTLKQDPDTGAIELLPLDDALRDVLSSTP